MNFVFRFKFNVLAVVAASLFTLTGAGPLKADWVDTFDGGFGQSWTFDNLNPSFASSATFSAGVVSDQLVLSDTTDGTRAPATGGKYGFGTVDGSVGNLADLLLSGTLNPGSVQTDTIVTLTARGNGVTGYNAGVNYRTGALQMERFNADNSLTTLINVNIPGWDGTTDSSVFLEFELVGSNLAARLYDAPGGTLLLNESVIDASFASGDSGVYAEVPGRATIKTMYAAYDNVSATSLSVSVPEPSSVALVAALGGAMAFRRRR